MCRFANVQICKFAKFGSKRLPTRSVEVLGPKLANLHICTFNQLWASEYAFYIP